MNLILLSDLPNTVEGWEGSLRCFLYPDDQKVLGSISYATVANLPNKKIEGNFLIQDNIVCIKGRTIMDGTPLYGLYLEVHPF